MKVIRKNTYGITDPNTKRWEEDLYRLTNRNISFGHGVNTNDQNIDGKMVQVSDTGTANTEFVVVHNLGRVPRFYDVKSKSVAGDFYLSTTPWTTTKAFLKCTTANVNVILFIH